MTAQTKLSYLESVKQENLTYLESVVAHEAAETDMKLKLDDMTTVVQVQRAFRARLRHEIAALRKDRKIALADELQQIELDHVLAAGHSVNFAAELRNKLDQRKLAEVSLLAEAEAAQAADNQARMTAVIAKKFEKFSRPVDHSYDAVVGKSADEAVTETAQEVTTS